MEIKADQYSKARGGFSIPFELTCAKCHASIGEYQKDGPGPFKRLYADRLQNSFFSWNENKVIECENCKRPLAFCLLYKKENRSSYTLFSNTVKAKPKFFCDYLKIVRYIVWKN
jgi:hypothetical protein